MGNLRHLLDSLPYIVQIKHGCQLGGGVKILTGKSLTLGSLYADSQCGGESAGLDMRGLSQT